MCVPRLVDKKLHKMNCKTAKEYLELRIGLEAEKEQGVKDAQLWLDMVTLPKPIRPRP